ncbi:hypothetical protein PFICI_08184 [Pestalotiopsis fici W106-1]|uniref:Altered inheritance of mitochondria protein 6 n=1 Tax=Pestalotiopsis fici (strain W106-1 / CGMCC3.15140) TaxID=1229662 RepID=W3X3K3_PESFW|nr:uncharacterized protein PFICI_08184 [Pestalotiopsis fici W106-1]ETS80655.1 hypothetical protein PFICI_08184 [Pestalotiopsis fici W106-1]
MPYTDDEDSGKMKRMSSLSLSSPKKKGLVLLELFDFPRRQAEYQPIKRSSVEEVDSIMTEEANSLEQGRVVPHRRKRRREGYLICGSLWALTLLAIFAFMDLVLTISRGLWGWDEDPDRIFSKWGEPSTGTEGLKWYPTDFLRDVQPIPCHSHNDYWRAVPLFSALHAGCIGVEADVHLFDDDDKLYVGHDSASLTSNRTLQSLYIDPIVELLNQTNPRTEFFNGTDTKNGVFDVDRDQSLTLLIDVKTNGAKTWPQVVAQLQPLRERGWLTYVENGVRHNGPVTVVGTGHTPFELIIANSTYRDYFFDAPLHKMYEDPDGVIDESTIDMTYNSTNSHYASVSLKKAVGLTFLGMSRDQMRIIRGQIKGAERRGLASRYWDTPGWPVGLRDGIWHKLAYAGVGMLNVDDLRSATRKLW